MPHVRLQLPIWVFIYHVDKAHQKGILFPYANMQMS